MVTVLEVSYDRNSVSVDVAVIESIVVDQLVAVDIEPLKERQLASADLGYNLAALHRSLCRPSCRL